MIFQPQVTKVPDCGLFLKKQRLSTCYQSTGNW